MIEYVFRPSRIVNGKRVLARVFCGRYALDKDTRSVQVSLNTPDAQVARKRLREIVVEKQPGPAGQIEVLTLVGFSGEFCSLSLEHLGPFRPPTASF